MKEKTLHPTSVRFIKGIYFVPVLFLAIFLNSCGTKPEKSNIEEIAAVDTATSQFNETIYAYRLLKTDLETGNRWQKIKTDSIALIQFKFYRGLSRPKFQLLTYFTVRKKFGEKEIPVELSETGNGTVLPTRNLILGNLDLNWANIVSKIMLPDSTINPLFDHVLFEPAIKKDHLYFKVTLRKADGSEYLNISMPSPPNFAGTQPDWDLADANPSPPAKPNE